MQNDTSRITDMALLEHLGRTVNFFASTTILMIAGVLTLIASSDKIDNVLSHHSFVTQTSVENIQIKLSMLGLIFIFAFFKFTWAMRQYTFCAVLLGAAPHSARQTLTAKEKYFAKQVAKLSDNANHQFNYGLRAYYFALAFLSWFINPIVFILLCALIVRILYRREFKSRTLRLLIRGRLN